MFYKILDGWHDVAVLLLGVAIAIGITVGLLIGITSLVQWLS